MKTNNLFKFSALATAVGFLVSGGAWAADVESSHNVSITIENIDLFEVDQNSVSITITADDGDVSGSFTQEATSSYDFTTNSISGKKITAAIGADSLADGLTLKVASDSPCDGCSGSSATALVEGGSIDVASGITNATGTGIVLTYTLEADATAAPGTTSTTVTYTLTDGGT